MKEHQRAAVWSRLLILLLLLLPLTLLFLAPATAITASTFVFWLALLGCFLVILYIFGMPEVEGVPVRNRARESCPMRNSRGSSRK